VTELAEALGIDKGGHISDSLDQLVESGLVSPDIGKNPETGAIIRERRFRLSDNYTRFYLKCIRPAASTIDNGSFALASLSQFREWESHAGFAFENLVVNHYRELLPFLHLGESLVYSAAPYRKQMRKGEKGAGLQIDLLVQTRRSTCLVEIKRRREIPYGIVDEVAEKARRLKRPKDGSLRAALVYEGELAASVPAEGYFDAIVPFGSLLGL